MTDAQKQNIEEKRRQGVGYKRIAGSLGLSENHRMVWTMPVRDWAMAYSQIMIFFAGRFAA